MKLKRDLFFLLLIIGVIGLLYFLSTKTKIKAMPVNDNHQTTMKRSECLKCHTAETLGALEQQHKHPGKWKDARVECTLCHKPATTAQQKVPLHTQRAADLARSLQP